MKKYILILFLFTSLFVSAQTTSVLWQETFNSTPNTGWTINTTDVSGDASQTNNSWLISDDYLGGDVLGGLITIPNTADQPTSITGYPQSTYLHICSSLAQGDGVFNCNFYASGQASYFARSETILNTTGLTNITLKFWWLCDGNANASVGEVYYRTSSSGTWTQLTNPSYYSLSSTWQEATVANVAFDNQSYLQFGFRFKHGFGGNDPAFAVDEISVTGESAIPDPPVADFTIDDDTICDGECIHVKSTSIGLIDTYEWIANTALSQNIVGDSAELCFVAPNSHDISLVVTNSGGSDTITKTIYAFAYPPFPVLSVTNNIINCSPSSGYTYTWYFEGSVVSGATSSSYTPSAEGQYTVVLNNPQGCSSTNEAPFQFLFTGLSNITSKQIELYPQPVLNQINIRGLDVKNINSIRIFDLTGKLIECKFQINVSDILIDSSNLPHGSYTLIINSQSEVPIVKQLIK